MRLIWNAGAAIAVTGLLSLGAAFAAGPVQPARAVSSPHPDIETVADMPHRHYTGLAEHFQAANTSHDGKLTLDQAKQANWKRVVKHFDDIDTDHAGFVTAAQIHAYNVSHRHSRKAPGES